MITARYHPHPESLAAKVISNLTLYPKRVLCIEDICEKFLSTRDARNIHEQLKKAVEHGFLEWNKDTNIYARGKRPMPSVLCEWSAPLSSLPEMQEEEA